MHFIFAFIFAFQLFACNYSLIQHSTNFSSESFQALHNHLSSLPFIKRQTSPSQIYNVSILVSIDGTPKHKEFDETLKLVKVFDTINLKMRQAGFNEPIIQFFVENVIFDSKDASILGETLYDPFYDWVDEYKSLYKTDYKLGVKFIRKSKDGFLGLAFENGFCNKKGAIVVSRYEPDSKSETYIISFIHEVLHLLGVVHVEKWEKMNNEKLKLEGKKETFRCSRRDLMTEKEGSSQIVSKCTLDQLNLKLGTFLSKKNCLIAAPFNPNAFSVNTLLTKNLDKESPETLALDKENLFLTKSKDTEENPISKAFKPSKVSTPDFSTLDVSTAIPLPPKVISEPLVRNINLDHEVVKDAYPDVISNPRIPRCNKIISNIVGS